MDWANGLDTRVLGSADRVTVVFNASAALYVVGIGLLVISALRGDSSPRELLIPIVGFGVLLLARRNHVGRLRQVRQMPRRSGASSSARE
jgi:hypothetical protein